MIRSKEKESHLIDSLKRFACISFVFLFILSCTSRTIYKKPENLITEDQMVELWTEIILANNAKSVKNLKGQKKINYLPFIYQKYAIDSARFMQSNIYYTSRVEEYEKMFKRVETKLRKTKEIYDPLSVDIDPTLPIWKKDSIRRSNREKRKKEDRLPINELEQRELEERN